ncbi:NUDIX hydrolase [Paenibacillus alvei]|uniref:NUDIX domain-containing protein n=1 Tax=Paenibacillus TaxID=44249 RepID=UPI000287BCE7|nr:NUDIX hydrolase [Paenibacillus alvei]EJW18064.1 ADP-ribose pyrophosphatase NudF [Paenibacillus alvei DSM 29]MCY9542116.1 NUDIX hydrolase [Paenibacillus alvei]MCY9703560.1 NUDIX hydrolase [Paenibacillus alvei]MCY9732441.1 NUDIX hydrolase [Paenibacillus alvei]MCY9754501.1 NUDIX hydrolase [Paenibacillus alvei]
MNEHQRPIQTCNHLEEVTIETKSIFDGKIIKLQVDTVKLPDGSTATREIVRHPGAVAVLAIKGEKMLVVEQYRKPLGRNQVEIPAGKLDPGEQPIEAAMRELEEETGYRANTLIPLGSFYTSPGFADEIIYLYVAEQLTAGEAHTDEDEFLEVGAMTLEEAFDAMRDGSISDAKTINAMYAWQIYKLTGKWPV